MVKFLKTVFRIKPTEAAEYNSRIEELIKTAPKEGDCRLVENELGEWRAEYFGTSDYRYSYQHRAGVVSGGIVGFSGMYSLTSTFDPPTHSWQEICSSTDKAVCLQAIGEYKEHWAIKEADRELARKRNAVKQIIEM